MKKSVIVCMGNELRGDDGIALHFYERLREDEEITSIADVVEMGAGVTFKPFEKVEGKIVVIDAVDFNGAPGEVRVFRLEEMGSLAGFTHRLESSVLSSMLKDKECLVVGIQPKNLEVGSEISKECLQAYEKVRSSVLSILHS